MKYEKLKIWNSLTILKKGFTDYKQNWSPNQQKTLFNSWILPVTFQLLNILEQTFHNEWSFKFTLLCKDQFETPEVGLQGTVTLIHSTLEHNSVMFQGSESVASC